MSAPGRRVYLLTHPRTASNLVTKILNIPAQNVPPRFQAVYFFRDPVHKGIEMGTVHTHMKQWTKEETMTIKEEYQKALNEFQQWLDGAEKHGQIAFVKEHAMFLTDPVAMTKFLSDHVEEEDVERNLEERKSLAAWKFQYKIPSSIYDAVTNIASSCNKTVLSDEFLLTFTPTFLIRHPAVVFPSYYRARIDIYGAPTSDQEARNVEMEMDPFMSFHWLRRLYDFYSLSNSPSHPIILDADDIIASPRILTQYAELAGLDPDKLRFEWDAAREEEMEKVLGKRGKRFVSTILESTGVLKDKIAGEINIDGEAEKWTGEWGWMVSIQMEKWVRASMKDYEFLKARRMKPEVKERYL